MPVRQDLKLDEETQDLIFKNGDFFVRDADDQMIQDTINSSPGWWKEFPIDGCDIIKYGKSNESQFQALSRKILIELTSDGYDVGTPIIFFDFEGVLNINPDATIRP